MARSPGLVQSMFPLAITCLSMFTISSSAIRVCANRPGSRPVYSPVLLAFGPPLSASVKRHWL